MSDSNKIEDEVLESGDESSQMESDNESIDSELMENDDDDDDKDDENDDEKAHESNTNRQTYVPNIDSLNKDEKLVCDESAYVMYHKAETGYPCLSFDIIGDNYGSGDDRANEYPMTFYMVSGTQTNKVHVNNLLVIKMSNINKIKKKSEDKDDDNDDSDSDDDNLDNQPELECAPIRHNGCVNRVRATKFNDKVIAASWSELANVHLWDLTRPLEAVDDVREMTYYTRNKESPSPLYTFSGHGVEGYAIDWSNVKPGMLASGDCNKNIFIWKPVESGVWHVDQRPLIGHTDSVEDLQWSPNEENVLASCSVDKSIRIWDIRARQSSSMVVVTDAHESDINVISWNRHEKAFLVSGGDDGVIKTWDLRQFRGKNPKPIATFKHHISHITSIEWHPTDSTVFAASGNDNQLTLWDLAVEKDDDKEEEGSVANLPPQLLFIHQGQKEIKEIHWHPQIPGVMISTAITGFDIFRTISV